MKNLKLKKVKIASITNPYIVFGGAQQAAGNNHKTKTISQDDCLHTKDKNDLNCNPHTNSVTMKTGPVNGSGSAAHPFTGQN